MPANKKSDKEEKPAEKPAEKAAMITKHRAAMTKQARGEGVTFDVLPPGKAMPSSTSRPVITPLQPEQSDNTLTAKPTAPTVHRELVLDPQNGSAKDEPAAGAEPAADIDIRLESAPELPDLESVGTAKKPVAAKADKAGPTLAELLSSKKSTETETAPETETENEAAPEPAEAEAPAADVKAKETKPSPEDQPDEKPPAKEAPADAEEPDAKKPAATTPDYKPSDQKSDADVAAAKSQTANENLDKVLNEDETAAAPAEHSDELKSALNDLDKSPEGKHPHEAELYGGKPVIVVHEPHPVRSALIALMWIILLLGMGLLALNFLIDAGLVSLGYDLPHTNLLEP